MHLCRELRPERAQGSAGGHGDDGAGERVETAARRDGVEVAEGTLDEIVREVRVEGAHGGQHLLADTAVVVEGPQRSQPALGPFGGRHARARGLGLGGEDGPDDAQRLQRRGETGVAAQPQDRFDDLAAVAPDVACAPYVELQLRGGVAQRGECRDGDELAGGQLQARAGADVAEGEADDQLTEAGGHVLETVEDAGPLGGLDPAQRPQPALHAVVVVLGAGAGGAHAGVPSWCGAMRCGAGRRARAGAGTGTGTGGAGGGRCQTPPARLSRAKSGSDPITPPSDQRFRGTSWT